MPNPSFRTSDRSHWCGNPLFIRRQNGLPRQCEHWLAMTAHFAARFFYTSHKPEKSPSGSDRLVSGNLIQLHSAGDLAAAQAAGADVDVLGSSVHDGLDALHIGLPGTVRSSVGVADLDAESNALVAEFALCHCRSTSLLVLAVRKDSLYIIADEFLNCKENFSIR